MPLQCQLLASLPWVTRQQVLLDPTPGELQPEHTTLHHIKTLGCAHKL